ncbi:MAG TPA: alpha/beta hydrolase [Anaerolineae bacterium]|nr:alpha/beta hydrolase [Anaerolineae bacterium]
MKPATWHQNGHTFTYQNHDIFYYIAGTGPPLLCLHGFPTSSHDFARITPLLAPHYTLICPDFLGFGFSAKPRPHTYSLFEQADIITALMHHLGHTTLHLLSHDMGNSVALELLRRSQLTITTYIMLNGSVYLKYYQPVITQRLLLNKLTGPIISRLRLIRQPAFNQQFGSLFAQPLPRSELDDFWATINYNDGPGIYHRLIQYLRERQQHELTWLQALGQHPAPLTIIWGQRDPVSVPAIADTVLTYRPHATYHPLHHVGHYPQWEDPTTTTNLILKTLS